MESYHTAKQRISLHRNLTSSGFSASSVEKYHYSFYLSSQHRRLSDAYSRVLSLASFQKVMAHTLILLMLSHSKSNVCDKWVFNFQRTTEQVFIPSLLYRTLLVLVFQIFFYFFQNSHFSVV